MQHFAATSSPIQQRWTVLSLVEWSSHHLVEQGFDEARLHAELLLAHVLKCSRLQLYMQFDRPLTPEELSAYRFLFKRRLAHEPLQYILGETDFMGLALYVNPAVLIPRPETEQLVEFSATILNSTENETLHVLDIGTGSGNIAIAIAKLAPNSTVTSVDISAEALEVAKRNIERHAIANIRLLEADVFEDFLPGEKFDMIISNPPYISVSEFNKLDPEIRAFEPRIATTDGGDGFRFIRRISDVAYHRLHAGGSLIMEIACNQSTQAVEIVENAGLADVRVLPDFAGHPRIITGRKS